MDVGVGELVGRDKDRAASVENTVLASREDKDWRRDAGGGGGAGSGLFFVDLGIVRAREMSVC